jgi:MFS family permease
VSGVLSGGDEPPPTIAAEHADDAAGPPGPASAAGSHRARRAFADGLVAFRYHDFRWFATGQLVSLIGTWMQQVAQAWQVLELGGDAFTLGALVAAQFLPVALFGLVGGVLADSLPKRSVLIVTQVMAMILAFVLFGLTVAGQIEMWQIFVLALLLGVSNAVDLPVRQAFVIDLVERRDLRNAIALNAAMFHGARIVGPAIAGITIGLVGVAAAYFVNGVSFVASIVSLLMIRGARTALAGVPQRGPGVTGIVHSLGEGLSFVRHTPLILLSVTAVGLVATFAMDFQVLGPVLAEEVLRSGAAGFGALMAAVGAGAFLAAMGLAFAPRPEPRVIAYGALVLGVASLVLALSRDFTISLVAITVAGGAAIAVAVTTNSTIQLVVPDHLRGRTMSVFVTIMSASVPVGGLLIGGIASIWGVPVAFGIGGLVAILVGVVTAIKIPRLLTATPLGPIDKPVSTPPGP